MASPTAVALLEAAHVRKQIGADLLSEQVLLQRVVSGQIIIVSWWLQLGSNHRAGGLRRTLLIMLLLLAIL